MAYRLGVDVGGTFTDLFLVDDGDHRQWRVKTPATPSDPPQGGLSRVAPLCAQAGVAARDPGNVVPRTTVATNPRLQAKGAPPGPVTPPGIGPIPPPPRSPT